MVEYLQLKLDDIPGDVKQQYELVEKATGEGWVYVEVWKVMTLGPWKHNMRPIQAFLVIDDIGIKCIRQEHSEHLYQIFAES